MAGWATVADFATSEDDGKKLTFGFEKRLDCSGSATPIAGQWFSLWKMGGTSGGAGGAPVAGATPAGTPGAALTNTDGSINFRDTGGTDKRFQSTFGFATGSAATIAIDDRLVGIGGIALTSTGDKTVSSAALTRYTGTASAVVEAWIEVDAADTATTAAVVSLNSYTDQGGTTGQAGDALTFPATVTPIGWMGRFPLASGDQGLRAISTMNVATAAGGTTPTGIIWLLKHICTLSVRANEWTEIGVPFYMPTTRVYSGAALAMRALAQGTGEFSFIGQFAATDG